MLVDGRAAEKGDLAAALVTYFGCTIKECTIKECVVRMRRQPRMCRQE